MKNSLQKKAKKKNGVYWIIFVMLLITGIGLWTVMHLEKKEIQKTPDKLLLEYMECISRKEYEKMYQMVDREASGNISQEEFIKRNSAIYEGIEMQKMEIEVLSSSEETEKIIYQTSFDTVAGKVSFQNQAFFSKKENGYQLIWHDGLIFPELTSGDKVQVENIQAKRGEILDRNGWVLAGKGIASSVGIVPGKLKNKDSAIKSIATLLDIEPEVIEKKLEQEWVKEDSFVPIKNIPKVEEIDLRTIEPDEEIKKEKERQEKLSTISGVMITDIEVREYPLGEAAAHLVGYVQSVTAQDLEEHSSEGYTENSVIGRTGLEGLFEKELKGKNGNRIYIVDEQGREKAELAKQSVQHGKDITLTIDSIMQKELYEQFKEDQSCSVAMHPYTGEVLALVSTPSYDTNDLIRGMANEEWLALNEDEKKPLYNRFRQVWCPGSTLKPIIGAIGIEEGILNPDEDFGNEGLSWQKDLSWGSYYVTTLHEYEPVTLDYALMYSDNIYFAKVALMLGEEKMERGLKKLQFNQEIPFPIKMMVSSYSDTEEIETEIQLADSGYGQGQLLVNPLHLACMYTAFCNQGNILKPYLLSEGKVNKEEWISQVYTKDTANRVLEGMKTAEIKTSNEDKDGTELGWFVVFTTEEEMDYPILIVSMVEDVKEIGGSGYVVNKDSKVLECWFQQKK